MHGIPAAVGITRDWRQRERVLPDANGLVPPAEVGQSEAVGDHHLFVAEVLGALDVEAPPRLLGVPPDLGHVAVEGVGLRVTPGRATTHPRRTPRRAG